MRQYVTWKELVSINANRLRYGDLPISFAYLKLFSYFSRFRARQIILVELHSTKVGLQNSENNC